MFADFPSPSDPTAARTGDREAAESDSAGTAEEAAVAVQLNSIQRRILGVLVEKAKTTNDNLLTLNALTTGCNQKSNRSPKMNLDSDDVLLELDEMCRMGAVVEVHGDGRVPKYKHRIYEWLEIGDAESAVIAELLLRGPQTLGELRGRAARMAEIRDMAALQPILRGLIQRKLVVELTPPGRGQIVTHGLYLDREWDKVRQSVAAGGAKAAAAVDVAPAPETESLLKRVSELEQQVGELQARLSQIENRLSKDG